MSGSLIVDVRSAIIDGVAALPALTTASASTGQKPLVTFGYKVGAKQRERVWTQDATFSHEPASLRPGKTFRNEVGRFNLRILIEGVGLDVETTSQRALEIGALVEDYIAVHTNWPALAGLNDLVIEGDGQLVEAFNDKGSLSELTYPIRYRARLT